MAGEAGKAVDPPGLVEIASRLGRERPLDELDVGCAIRVAQRQARYRLAIIGIRRLPAKRVTEARRRINFDVCADQVEHFTHGWAHRDPIHAADPHIKADLGTGEAVGPHHSATCSGSVIAANTRRGEPSTVTNSLTVRVVTTLTMVGGYRIRRTALLNRAE